MSLAVEPKQQSYVCHADNPMKAWNDLAATFKKKILSNSTGAHKGEDEGGGPDPPLLKKIVLEIFPKMQLNQYLRGGGVGRSLPHVGFIADIFLAQNTHKKGVTPLFRHSRHKWKSIWRPECTFSVCLCKIRVEVSDTDFDIVKDDEERAFLTLNGCLC